MQVEERRACPSCGADNPDDADFCWQCFARFVPVPPTPGTPGVPTGWGPSGSPQPTYPVPAPTTTPSGRGSTIAKIVVGVVVATVAAGAVRSVFRHEYHVPASVAGLGRIQNEDTAAFERDMAAEGDKENLVIEAAVYGTGVTPDVLFVLVNGSAAENTDELFNSFLDGIAQSGVSTERDRTSTGHHGDAEYRCIPLDARGLGAAACIWREDASVGMTLDLTATGDGSDTLIAAYDATHA
jgi:hypothetical protein